MALKPLNLDVLFGVCLEYPQRSAAIYTIDRVRALFGAPEVLGRIVAHIEVCRAVDRLKNAVPGAVNRSS
jgi:hypothetical protein